jgi:uncharacterized protein
LNSGSDLNYQSTDYGMSALMIALSMNYSDIAKLLVKNGADVNQKNKAGRTALDIAEVNYPNPDIIRLLKEAGGKKKGD